jgi:DNA-binding transcriptional MerR regulator
MPASRPAGKSAAAFRTISEVSEELDVPQHVLRFWEGKFSQVRPLKRGGGRRYYRPEDIDLLRRIRSLLYNEGYTIKGVQRLLREGRGKDGEDSDGEPDIDTAEAAAPAAAPDLKGEIEAAIEELGKLRDLLKAAGKGRP